MRKFIILLLVAVLFAGCNPCKRLTRLCPPEVHSDSIYIETVKLDTLVLIAPADTTYIEIPIFTLEDLGIIVENDNQEITIGVNDGVFTAKVICKEDSLIAIIAEKEKLLSKQKTVIKEVEVEVAVTHIPKWAWISLIIVLCEVVGGIVYIYYKIKGGALKTALNRFR